MIKMMIPKKTYSSSNNNNNNKVARASAAARGVSFIFGRFFVEIRKTCILRGFRQQQDVSVFSFCNSSFLFFGSVLAKVSQIPCFSCFFKFNFSVIFDVFVWKAAKARGFCMVDVWKSNKVS